MQIISTVQALERERTHWAGQAGLVPTMGYLHEGHLALLRRARGENRVLVTSIFVNPTQFGPHEDLERYPRNLERDLRMLESIGVDFVFTPTASEMYPQGFTTYVDPLGPLTEEGEGAVRPGHFRGVATIVLKLFQLVQPQQAYFGQKDAQQVAVIQNMVADFNLPIKLCILPTIREQDGLALSSRNSFLDPASRAAASVLYQALEAGRSLFDTRPPGGPAAVRQAMIERVACEPLARLEYAEVRDAQSFLPLTTCQAPALLLIAASIGSTRLIDNFVCLINGTWDTGTFASELF